MGYLPTNRQVTMKITVCLDRRGLGVPLRLALLSGPCSVCASTLGMLGYPLLSCCQVLKLLSVSTAWNPLPCWASPCLGAAWSLLPSVPSPLNKRRGSV